MFWNLCHDILWLLLNYVNRTYFIVVALVSPLKSSTKISVLYFKGLLWTYGSVNTLLHYSGWLLWGLCYSRWVFTQNIPLFNHGTICQCYISPNFDITLQKSKTPCLKKLKLLRLQVVPLRWELQKGLLSEPYTCEFPCDSWFLSMNPLFT